MVEPTDGKVGDGDIKLGFEMKLITLDISKIMPVKPVTPKMKKRNSYKKLRASIQAGGLVQPLVVWKNGSAKSSFTLLKGHCRLEILKNLGEKTVPCILAKEYEAYTYSKFVNNPPPIEMHKMILAALKTGATEQELAERLSMNVEHIVKKRNMLNGVCPEVMELLKGRNTGFEVFKILKKMKSCRQIDAVNLMNDMDNHTAAYAKILLGATSDDELVKPDRPKKKNRNNPENLSRLQQEMATVEKDYKTLSEENGFDTLKLTFGISYIKKLLRNKFVQKYLGTHHKDTLEAFEKIAHITLSGAQDIETDKYRLETS